MNECGASCEVFCQSCEGAGCMSCQSTCRGCARAARARRLQTACEACMGCEAACESYGQSADVYEWEFNPVEVKSNATDRVVRGLWAGAVGGEEVLCAACNGYLWQLTLAADGSWTKTSCGAVDTAGRRLHVRLRREAVSAQRRGVQGLGRRFAGKRGRLPADGGRGRAALRRGDGAGGHKQAERRPAHEVFPRRGGEELRAAERDIASVDYVRDVATGAALSGWSADTGRGARHL